MRRERLGFVVVASLRAHAPLENSVHIFSGDITKVCKKVRLKFLVIADFLRTGPFDLRHSEEAEVVPPGNRLALTLPRVLRERSTRPV